MNPSSEPNVVSPESKVVSFPTTETQATARTLARGRKTQNWLAIALTVSVFFIIGILVFCCVMLVTRQKVIVLDLASGDLVVTPIVDPASSPEILEQMATWCANTVTDRTLGGLDHDELVGILFDRPTAKVVRDEFDTVKQQYKDKQIISKINIKHWIVQPIGGGFLMITVTGQVFVDGVVDGAGFRDTPDVTLKFKCARDPDLGRDRRYPLMCFGFSGLEDIDAQINAPAIN